MIRKAFLFGILAVAPMFAQQHIGPAAIKNSTIQSSTISGSTVSGDTISGGTISGAAISGGSINGTPIASGSIDGTPIGGSTPSSGNFTAVATTGNLNVGGSAAVTSNFNAGGTITVPNFTLNTLMNGGGSINIGGSITSSGNMTTGGNVAAVGNVTASGSIAASSNVTASTGDVTAGSGLKGQYGYFAGQTPSFYPSQGMWLTWNTVSPGLGASEFSNNHGSGGGGFWWQEGATGSSHGTTTMTLSGSGLLSPLAGLSTTGPLSGASLTTTGAISASGNISGANVSAGTMAATTFTGALSGNATTATSLSTSCSQTSGPAATSGSSCVPIPFAVGYLNGGTNISISGSGTFVTLPFTGSWATVNTSYAASCTIIGPITGKPYVTDIPAKGTSSISVHLSTLDGNPATAFGLDCAIIGGR